MCAALHPHLTCRPEDGGYGGGGYGGGYGRGGRGRGRAYGGRGRGRRQQGAGCIVTGSGLFQEGAGEGRELLHMQVPVGDA